MDDYERKKQEFIKFIENEGPEMVTCILSLGVPDTAKVTSKGEIVDGSIFDEMTTSQKNNWKVNQTAYDCKFVHTLINYFDKNFPELTANKVVITYKFNDHYRIIFDKILERNATNLFLKITDYYLNKTNGGWYLIQMIAKQTSYHSNIAQNFYNAVVHILDNSSDFFTNKTVFLFLFQFDSKLLPYVYDKYLKKFGDEGTMNKLITESNVPAPLFSLLTGLHFNTSFGARDEFKKFFTFENCVRLVSTLSSISDLQYVLYYIINNFDTNEAQQYVVDRLLKNSMSYIDGVTNEIIAKIKNPNMTCSTKDAPWVNLLHMCLGCKFNDAANILINKGIDLSARVMFDSSWEPINLLQYAMYKRCYIMARKLIDIWPDLEEADKYGWRTIHYAALYADKATIDHLMSKNVFVGCYVTKYVEISTDPNEELRMYPADFFERNRNLQNSDAVALQVKCVTMIGDLFI